jgi:hypothetical protein
VGAKRHLLEPVDPGRVLQLAEHALQLSLQPALLGIG